MGTRADFYEGRGKTAKWLGSIAWDGHPPSIRGDVLRATTADAFRAAVSKFLASRDDATMPEQGWPWPWDNSQTTDYAYAFDEGKVYGSCFGHAWFDATQPEPEHDYEDGKPTEFPNMSSIKKVTLGRRSGVIVFRS